MRKLSELSILERESLFRTLRISITHHSNAIEGTSLSYGETKTLLQTLKTANNKPIDEQLIILGFAEAYDVVIREANNKSKMLDSSFIKDLHYLIFSNAHQIMPQLIRKPIGAYRMDYAKIQGSDVKLSPPTRISQELENLLFKFPSNKLTFAEIAEFHILFEKIHPFSDGNGRIGRLILHFHSIQNDYIPPLIEDKKREQYLNCLNDKNEFADFLKDCQKNSLDLIATNATKIITKKIKQPNKSKDFSRGR